MDAAAPHRALPRLNLPPDYNYAAVFLTMACNLKCDYCINSFGTEADPKKSHRKIMRARDWIDGLNRLVLKPDLPVTLQGGEPSLHPDFYEIIGGIDARLNIDILTNLQFDIEEFMRRVPPGRIKRDAPYASIRVSFHPQVMKIDDIRNKILTLLGRGYSVGIWAVAHPSSMRDIDAAREQCIRDGIDFRLKEFLGLHENALHGRYKYPESLSEKTHSRVMCKPSELIIGPSGHVYRCHGDLYGGRAPVGHILDESLRLGDTHQPCDFFGFCNPCDVKIKTNRFQIDGHTSVDIIFPDKD
jgi:hypothetical protein